ncbi:PilZ domain-containing protein [Pseudobacteroides cellulosolvens]|uniref:Type IV pilus assembly PilZ n=1 Tax=Pseudobacteroides cellulosolvens ATCC 35603 = DSM 2933 TaxID=398512 RepID=A0A0L6JJ48_9FIRM|nr:PilZ domain-containing protein [Pseudobacteroides cellulosolvens]KNY25755.1 type IV pilus assembly PilZ [Pseudobacteroides cellulosolvens ATCC 35603 = DSM 2933]
MAGYNLDDKTGLLSVFNKASLKVIKVSSDIGMKHYNVYNNLVATVELVNDPIIKLTIKEGMKDLALAPRDIIVLSYNSDNDVYLLSASIISIEDDEPYQFTVSSLKIEKLKDLRKAERFFISNAAYIKVQGIMEPIFGIATNISTSGIKIVCNINLLMEDVMELTVMIDKNQKIVFRGKIVRKNKIMDLYEYGFEIYEISEVNRRNLHHYVNTFKFDNP